MVDPTSDVGEISEDEAPTCANCGETILETPEHRVRTHINEGSVEHRHFCSPDCLEAFE